MKYIINHTIVFDPDNKTLTLKNSGGNFILLSNPATRLLSEFINNNKNNLVRVDILKSVWENYGFSPSNASLNNHVSELRKAFLSLNMNKDVIFTVPRIGLRMDAEIHPEISDTLTTQQIDETSETISPEKKSPVIFSQRKQAIISLFTTLSLLLAFGIAIVTFFTLSKKEGVSFLITHKKCAIYKMNDNKPYVNPTTKIVKEMEKERENCSQEDIDIFYAAESSNMKHLTTRLIKECDKNGNKGCITYRLLE